ncbi:MAG: permease, partial [Planctomycetota bacterium]
MSLARPPDSHAGSPPLPQSVTTPGSGLGLDLRASFLFMALLILVVFYTDPGRRTFALIFVSIVLEAFPFMLLGSLISGFVEVFLSKDRLAGWLPRREVLLTFMAAGMGVAFPVCECAIVPVVRRFLRKGVPLSAAIAYLLAGPIFNPVVGASTFVAYSAGEGGRTFWIVAIRLLSGFVIAFVVGLVMGRLFPGQSACRAEKPGAHDHNDTCGCHTCGCESAEEHEPGSSEVMQEGRAAKRSSKIHRAVHHGVDDFLDVTPYLVMGAFVAGLLQTLVSRQAFLDLAEAPFLAIPFMMLLAFVLNLCSEADAFLAASFRGTLPVSAQMAFMVLGPMLDIK